MTQTSKCKAGDYDLGLERLQLFEPMRTQPSEQHTGPCRHEGHIERPDTRPIEELADRSRIAFAKQGASIPAQMGLLTPAYDTPT